MLLCSMEDSFCCFAFSISLLVGEVEVYFVKIYNGKVEEREKQLCEDGKLEGVAMLQALTSLPN